MCVTTVISDLAKCRDDAQVELAGPRVTAEVHAILELVLRRAELLPRLAGACLRLLVQCIARRQD